MWDLLGVSVSFFSYPDRVRERQKLKRLTGFVSHGLIYDKEKAAMNIFQTVKFNNCCTNAKNLIGRR